MAGQEEENSQPQRIVSLIDKHIPEVDVIKTLDDTILGVVLLGKFSYADEYEVNYTYIKRLEIGLEQSDFWQLLNNSRRHPEKGYIPKILAYSTRSQTLKGYLDNQSDQQDSRKHMIRSEDEQFVSSLPSGKIKELYFEPFPENLRMEMHKRTKDKVPYTEQELTLFITSMIQTLKSLQDHGTKHGNLSMECIVPSPEGYYLYHPTLIPASVNAYSRVHALIKHYAAPEVVDMILECNSEQEYTSVQDDIDWAKADIFSVGLIALEMASLVEEEDWYNEDMILRKDILELKMNLVRNGYSSKLTGLLAAIVSPYQVRPDLDGMVKLALPKQDTTNLYQKLLQKPIDLGTVIGKPTSEDKIPSDFSSDKEISSKEVIPERNVSDVDSKEARNLQKGNIKKKEDDHLSEDLPPPIGSVQDKGILSPNTFPHKKEQPQKHHLDELVKMESVKEFDSMLFSTNKAPQKELSPRPIWPLKHQTMKDSQTKQMPVLPFDPSTLQTTIDANESKQAQSQMIPQRMDIWASQPSQFDARQVRLPPMQSTEVVGGATAYSREPSPAQATTKVHYKRYEPTLVSPTLFETFKKDLAYSPRECHPTGKVTVREDRSKSPKVVSIKKYIIKDGQKVLISEENFPGYDDGFRGYIDLRGKTPERVQQLSPPPQNSHYSPAKVQMHYLAEPPRIHLGTQPSPMQVSSIKKSLEPVFGTDSMYKPLPGTDSVQKKTALSSSKIHSLAALQRVSHQDFSKMADEIKNKLDELILKEKAREDRENTDAEPAGQSRSNSRKSRKSRFQQTPMTNDNVSSKTVSHLQIDLRNVECCKDCRRLQRDKKSHLYKCLNHPSSPRYVEVLGAKSAKSITPERKPESIKRKLIFQPGEIDLNYCPRYYRALVPSPKSSAPGSKKLVPLVQNTHGKELVTADQVKKFRESMAEARERQLKSKAGHVAAEVLNLEMAKKERGKSQKKKEKLDKDLWSQRLQLNERKLAGHH